MRIRKQKAVVLSLELFVVLIFLSSAAIQANPLGDPVDPHNFEINIYGPDHDWNYWDNNPHMYSIKSGNVGIGTTNPTDKLHVVGDIYCTGKLTSDGGNDPPYVLYNKETRQSIIDRVAVEVPEDKQEGAVLFWNGELDQFEIYNAVTGEFRDILGNLLTDEPDDSESDLYSRIAELEQKIELLEAKLQ